MRDFSIKKLYYSISEVSKITEVEQYVLRYWETEFEGLSPQKNRAGNRAYTNKDIQLVLVIKHLLREKKYTIEGAKKILTETGLEQLISSAAGKPNAPEEKNTHETTEQVPVRDSFFAKNEDTLHKKTDLRKELQELKLILHDLLKFF